MAKIGACGDNCDFCRRYKAATSGKIEELEKEKIVLIERTVSWGKNV
jgi:hypothetical protein